MRYHNLDNHETVTHHCENLKLHIIYRMYQEESASLQEKVL
jgi:hypothetical protein